MNFLGRSKVSCFGQCCRGLILPFLRFLVLKVDRFWNQLCYFLIISLAGYLALRFSDARNSYPKSIDIFFTCVSALTGSSMSTVEMEFFSNFQLIVMTILMFVGGEVFVSVIGLYARSKFYSKNKLFQNQVSPDNSHCNLPFPNSPDLVDQVELGLVNINIGSNTNITTNEEPAVTLENSVINSSNDDDLKYNSIRYLVYVVLGYLLVTHVVGSSVLLLYVSVVPSTKQVLKQKGLHLLTFSVFTIVSTFANCGFVPTNENMVVFIKNSLLLLIVFPQGLFGGTLYPTCLRVVIWVLKRITNRKEFDYILRNSEGIIYRHLFVNVYSSCLAATVFGFIFIQLLLFCALQWKSGAMAGLNSFEKLVASLFQVVNSRHTGESVFDISIISPAILVLFVVMMYLPPYTLYLPTRDRSWDARSCKVKDNKTRSFVQALIFSQLSYLAIFIILVCITERESLKNDPLNFNVLNITVEVISAYGNVGFSTGYSCERRLIKDSSCKDTWYGFVGRWSNQGKFILIVVMFFGRLKKFNMKGGKAWKIS